MLRGIHQYLSDIDDIYLVSSNRFCLILDMSHSQMLGKVEYGGGSIFKVVLEC